MADPDWQSSDSYEPLRSLDRIGLAWEFLRRNPGYCQFFDRIRRRARKSLKTSASAAPEVAVDPRWGLAFCCRSEARRLAAVCLLVARRAWNHCTACRQPR